MDINGMIKSDYFDKGTDFSVTDFTKNDYQLWVAHNYEKDSKPQSFKPWVGQLIHKASYDHPEVDVIKEFSGVFTWEGHTIGGSIDRIVKNQDLWGVEDIKTQGLYPAKKAFKEMPDYWITQLSIYRFMMDQFYDFNMSEHATIHQYVMSHQKNKDGMEEYNKLPLITLSNEQVESLLTSKIDMATSPEPPKMDCETSWQCGYCDYTMSCPTLNKSF